MARLGTKVCPRCGGVGKIPDDSVGPVMRALRQKHGVAIKALSRELGVSRTYIYDLEKGVRNWSPELIERYREGIGVLAT